MKPHAKTALSLALAIVGGMAAGMRCDASVTVETPTQINPRVAAYTVKTVADPFDAILRRANIAPQPQTDRGAQDVGLDIGLDVGLERTVVDEIRARPKIRMSEIAVKYQVTKRTVERVFSKLTQEGKIARVGGKRFGHWEVVG